jgi:hypothetical protein
LERAWSVTVEMAAAIDGRAAVRAWLEVVRTLQRWNVEQMVLCLERTCFRVRRALVASTRAPLV